MGEQSCSAGPPPCSPERTSRRGTRMAIRPCIGRPRWTIRRHGCGISHVRTDRVPRPVPHGCAASKMARSMSSGSTRRASTRYSPRSSSQRRGTRPPSLPRRRLTSIRRSPRSLSQMVGTRRPFASRRRETSTLVLRRSLSQKVGTGLPCASRRVTMSGDDMSLHKGLPLRCLTKCVHKALCQGRTPSSATGGVEVAQAPRPNIISKAKSMYQDRGIFSYALMSRRRGQSLVGCGSRPDVTLVIDTLGYCMQASNQP